jgi:hypothetical protein
VLYGKIVPETLSPLIQIMRTCYRVHASAWSNSNPLNERLLVEAHRPHHYFSYDKDFRRWYANVARGSPVTAQEWFRRDGFVCARFGTTTTKIAKMSQK